MSNSKKDFFVMSKLIYDFINNLTDSQFNSLINGTAEIKYSEKAIDNSIRVKYNNIIYNIATMDCDEDKFAYIKENEELGSKSRLIEICKYLKIEFKVKDTIDSLIKSIIEFAKNNKDDIIYKYNREVQMEDSIGMIANKLEEFLDVKEAREYLVNCKEISNKANILKLAKRLNVFIDREASYEVIVESIIKSVVEAKIRSYTIRKKIITE